MPNNDLVQPPPVNPPQPPADPPAAAKPDTLLEDILAMVPVVDRAALFRWTPTIAAIVVAVAAYWLIDPFRSPEENETDQVARAWNRTIGRLGIEAVYPPQEDMFVGDIYLSLKLTETGQKHGPVPNSVVFAGRGIKIGRASGDTLAASYEKRPYEFRDAARQTNPPPPDPKVLVPVLTETIVMAAPAGGEIEPYLTAFPGLSIKHFVETEAAWWQVALGRKAGETEEISIPSPETYSIQAQAGLELLLAFCRESPKKLCRETTARALLAVSFGEEVNETKNGTYIYEPYVSLIRQVFVTRKIEINRYRGDSLKVDLSTQETEGENTPSQGNAAPSPGGANNQVSHDERFSTRMKMDQVFARPVAFGFRRVALTAKDPPQPARPSK
ncbi:hypothetical protein RMR16_024375 (plasmid) [Agrobacterium sp. rho-13.3]|uniref:hypothetical protein n=1 Tax=Agrobacterium sp. rho-13.3 TaxID=3072980 RepID=UPI002A10AF93|nr:hypothetical protein [Agrobacterium sp. rho-13.3]MDX8311948.1 hypothetical protein [Agrobacterium sp. rho-13.3]